MPLLYRPIHSEDLIGWRGDTDALGFASLVRALANRIGLDAAASEQVALQPSTGFDNSILGERRALNEGKLILVDTHLKLLRRLSILDTWNDRCITAGDDWRDQIHDALERANLIIFLWQDAPFARFQGTTRQWKGSHCRSHPTRQR